MTSPCILTENLCLTLEHAGNSLGAAAPERKGEKKKKSGLVAFRASGQSFMILLHSTDAQGFKEIDAF